MYKNTFCGLKAILKIWEERVWDMYEQTAKDHQTVKLHHSWHSRKRTYLLSLKKRLAVCLTSLVSPHSLSVCTKPFLFATGEHIGLLSPRAPGHSLTFMDNYPNLEGGLYCEVLLFLESKVGSRSRQISKFKVSLVYNWGYTENHVWENQPNNNRIQGYDLFPCLREGDTK